jgi:hypothetical protein
VNLVLVLAAAAVWLAPMIDHDDCFQAAGHGVARMIVALVGVVGLRHGHRTAHQVVPTV